MDKNRILVFVFGASAMAVWACFRLITGRRSAGAASAPDDRGSLRTASEPFEPYGYRLVLLLAPGLEERVRSLIDAGGGFDDLLPREFFGIQLFFSVCSLLSVPVMLLTPLSYGTVAVVAALVAVFAWYVPFSWLMSKAKARRKEVLEELPFCLDLMSTAMLAGYDFNAAVGVYVGKGSAGPLRDELAVMLQEIRLAKTRREAITALSERLGVPEMQTVATAVIEGGELGTGIADILKVQAEDIRRRRFIKAEKLAARAPAKMIAPMALFIVPATMIVIFVPIVLRFIRR